MINEKFLDSLPRLADRIYTEDQLEAVEQHIRKNFGEFPHMFQEVMSPDIRVDICVIPPAMGRNFYTLVTLGMGAYKMTVPDDLREKKVDRAELVITLPPDWNFLSQEERWIWPVKLLKMVSRIPIDYDTWLGWGHTVDNGEPFASNTELCGSILVSPQGGENELNMGGNVCVLPGGEEVNFYHLIPLYRQEMNFKKFYGAELLIEFALADVPHVVNIHRPDGCEGWDEEDGLADFLEEFEMGLEKKVMEARVAEPGKLDPLATRIYYEGMIMDDAEWHLDTLRNKSLPVDELNAYSHIAIYMRWCMEHDLMSLPFVFRFADVIDDVKENGFTGAVDLREFIRDSEAINGCLIHQYFNEEGVAFAQYYYGDDGSHCFPADVDEYAEKYVASHYGEEKLNSGVFLDEEYLFVPYNEEYYRGLSEYIEKSYDGWRVSYAGMKSGIMN